MNRPSTPSHLAVTKRAGAPSTPRVVGRGSHALWAVPLGAALLIGGAGFFGNRAMEGRILAGVRNELESRRDAGVQALRDWVEAECAKAKLIAVRRTVREQAPRLASATEQERSKLEAVLREELAVPLEIGGFEAFAIMLQTGRVIVKSVDFAYGKPLSSSHTLLLADVFSGQTKLLPPMQLDDALNSTLVLVGTPLELPDGSMAALLLQVPPSRDLTRIAAVASIGRTGESYIYDKDGRVLSRHRFESHVNADGSSKPPPWAVSNLDGSSQGFSLTPYIGYRGVPVLGAYRWLQDLGLGVMAKMDADEAFESLNYMRTAFWSVFVALIAAGVLMTIGSALRRRSPRDRLGALQQVGQYRLIEKIGEGAMGRVYRAQHAMLRRPTAVKLLEESAPDAIQRFEREVQLTSQLYHPNTVAIYDYGRTPEDVFYYAMEFLDGIDLAVLLEADGAMPPARVVHILRQICGSLAEAHTAGLVHRDIKPSNIMLMLRGGEADVVKVVDFGLAKLMEPPRGPGLTRDGTIFGTPGFIPPETLRDPGTFDARGDLYAMGALAYEMLTGKPPFDRTTALEMWHLHVEVSPPDPSIRLGGPLPSDLEMLVLKLLAKDPAHRPQSALDVLDLLDRCSVTPWTQAAARTWWATRGTVIWRQTKEPKEPSVDADGREIGDQSTRVFGRQAPAPDGA